MLIEGASGSGKTFAAQELLYNVSRSREEGTRRGVLYFTAPSNVTSEMDFFAELVRNCNGFLDKSFTPYDVLTQACRESCKENYGNRALLVIDDAQTLATINNQEIFKGIMNKLRRLTEFHNCDVILIVSNGTILKKARRCSGLSSEARLV